ncbi:MAG: rRNA pseudouridine synthase, partial [Bacilli bacterium]|nr:rRNA pseudouridine synthase [Bacilli bacterium]
LLTNDGVLTNAMLHPSNNIEKIYIAKIKGVLTPGHKKSLETGVVIDGKKTAPAKVKIVRIDKKTNTSVVEIMIHEGRNHQIKNMFSALGYEVTKLRRESVAFLTCDGVKVGEYRFLSIKEVKMLYSLINIKK